MRDAGLNKTHLEILKLVYLEEATVSQLAGVVHRSVSWTSGCVGHLVGMDLVAKRKRGLRVLVGPAPNEMAQSLAVLLVKAPMIDLSLVLDRSGLAIMLVLLAPGATTEEISRQTGLSMPTIWHKIRLWRGMGIIMKIKGTGRYIMHPSQKALKSFIVRYSRWRNGRTLAGSFPNALIIWQWRDEYLFSIPERRARPGLLSAGPTRLDELGYDIFHAQEYYLHHPGINKVSEGEALVQSLVIDPNNPRIARFIREGIQRRGVNPRRLLMFGKKYGLKTVLTKVVEGLDRKETVRVGGTG